MNETIVVNKNVQGNFGPQVLVGKEYYSFGKFFKGKTELPLGVPVSVDVFVTEAGKKYINKVEAVQGMQSNTPPIVAPVFKDTPIAKSSAKMDVMSKEDWAAKDLRISRQGCIQVAVQVTGDFEAAVELANKMLTFVNGGK